MTLKRSHIRLDVHKTFSLVKMRTPYFMKESAGAATGIEWGRNVFEIKSIMELGFKIDPNLTPKIIL